MLFLFQGIRSQQGYELTREMFKEVNSIKSFSMTMYTKERIKDEIREEKSFFKVRMTGYGTNNAKPYKIYFKQYYPLKNYEGLYIEGQNENMVLLSPEGFPWFNFSLDPNGHKMRISHHHPIMHTGYQHLVSILEYLAEKYKDNINDIIQKESTVRINKRVCYKIIYENPAFRYINYTVKKDEDLISIAAKRHINDYMILELNGLEDYHAVKQGDAIIIPNDYAKKMILYLDTNTKLPYIIKVFDDKGLFEEYRFEDVVINPEFNNSEFTTEYPDYQF